MELARRRDAFAAVAAPPSPLPSLAWSCDLRETAFEEGAEPGAEEREGGRSVPPSHGPRPRKLCACVCRSVF